MNLKKSIIIEYKNKKLNLNYFLRKGAEDKNILYLHGLGCTKSDFYGAIDKFYLKKYTLVGFDFPGHNNSEYLENLDINDLVEITYKFIKKLKLKNIFLVGHSMGGLVGQLYAAKYTKTLSSFVNIEGGFDENDCFFSKKALGSSREEFIENIFPRIQENVSENKNKGFKIYSKHLEKLNPNAFFDYAPLMVWYPTRGNLINRFKKINILKMFIYGSENNQLPYLDILKSGGIKLQEIKKSNHWPMHDNPKDFYKSLVEFFEK